MITPRRELSQHPEAIKSRQKWAENREARRAYHKAYRRDRVSIEDKREKYRKNAKARRQRVKAFLVAARDVPCGGCGESFPPAIMDFDHIFGEKSFNIAHFCRSTYRSNADIVAEVRKCWVLCPNCHRLRHHNERVAAENDNFYWTDDTVAEFLPRMIEIEV